MPKREHIRYIREEPKKIRRGDKYVLPADQRTIVPVPADTHRKIEEFARKRQITVAHATHMLLILALAHEFGIDLEGEGE